MLYSKGGETLEEVAQRSHIPGSIQGQAGCGSEQPGVVEGVPAHDRGVQSELLRHTQIILRY